VGDGRRRWLDAYWEDAHLVVEVDGLWHMEATAWRADRRRDSDLTISGLQVRASRRSRSGMSLAL
jgi:very-short-patch-repair endonuclease